MLFPIANRDGSVYDTSIRGYNPRRPDFATNSMPGSGQAGLSRPAPVATKAPLPVQFAVRDQLLREFSYGGVSRMRGDEDKTGVLGGSFRRRGAARALLG